MSAPQDSRPGLIGRARGAQASATLGEVLDPLAFFPRPRVAEGPKPTATAFIDSKAARADTAPAATDRCAVELDHSPCPICNYANAPGTRYCAGCGTVLSEGAGLRTLFDGGPIFPPQEDDAETTSLGHRTLVGAPGLTEVADDGETLLVPGPRAGLPAIPGGEHTLLGAPRPAIVPRPRRDTAAWEGPTVLDGRADEVQRTPASGHPALPRSVGEVILDLDEGPDAPLPAITPLPSRPGRPVSPPLRPQPRGLERLEAARRLRRRHFMVLVVTAVLAALATVVGLSWVDDGFRAELAGDLTVTRTSSGYLVQVGVRTSAPARVSHPGGRAVVDGDQRLRFELEDARIRLGDNPIVLSVSPGQGRTRTLTLHVMVYYKLVAEPSPPDAVRARLELQPGWRVRLPSGGRVEARADGVYGLVLTPGPVPRPLHFILEAPDGRTLPFDEALTPVRP